MKKNAVMIDLEKEIAKGTVDWVTGMGRAPHQDPLLEIAFYNNVSGNAKNPWHAHALSTERILVIQGGMTLNIEGETVHIGPLQMISIPPKVKHNIISYDEGTIAFNIRNSPQ